MEKRKEMKITFNLMGEVEVSTKRLRYQPSYLMVHQGGTLEHLNNESHTSWVSLALVLSFNFYVQL